VIPRNTLGASGVVVVVTGAILGQPYSVVGGYTLTLVLPQVTGGTFLAGDSAYGTFTSGPAESFAGGIGGTIMTALSQTYIAGQASGTVVLGPFSGAGLIGGGYSAGSTATRYSGCSRMLDILLALAFESVVITSSF
jgi:hypothetical protein